MLNVSVSEAQSNLAEILDRVHRDKQRIALGNEGEPLAVLVPIDDLGLLAGHGGPALQDGEQRFRDFAETASDWFWETDEHLRFSYFSGRHDDIGLEIKKTLGKTRPEVTIEDTAQKKWRAHLADLAVQKPFKDFRYAGRARDGRVIQLSVSGRPIFDEAGNFKGYRGTGTDITALTKAENALTAAKERAVAAEAQLDEALEAMSEGFAYFDAEDRLIRCNSKHRELFPSHAEAMVPGARFEDLLRKQVQNIHLPWAAGREEEWIAERVAQHRNPGEPVEQRFANGRVIRLSEYKTRSGGIVSIRTDITELKRAEEEARDSRDRIRLIADNLPASVTYCDTEQRYRFVNRTAQEWYARSVEDILGHTVREIIGPGDHDRLSANLEAALSGEEQRFEQNGAYPDGKSRVVEFSYVPHFDEDGKVQGWFSLGNDITERKCAEAALRESEERLKLITNAVPAGISYFDREQRFRFANEQYESLLGLKPSELVGKTLEEALGKKPYEVARQYAQRALSGQTVSFENILPAKNGGQISVAVSYVPDVGVNGRVNGVFALVQDITERKRAGAALQESEGRFRDFGEAASDWFWETDAEHCFTWFSDRVEDVTGVPAEFHIGKSRLELAADQVEQDKWRAHLEALEARRPFRDFRYLRRGHDGRLQHMSSSGVPVFDAEGNFKGYRGTGTDISAEVKAEEMAATAQERFMAAVESVSDGFALFDADDRMVFCNTRFKAMNPDLAPKLVPGVTFEELLRDNIAANRILDALGDEESFIRERMAQHRNPSGPLVQQRRDGRWLELREERTQEGATFLVNTDITERKRAGEALRESEALFRSFIDNLPIEIFVRDTTGHFALVNRAWERVQGVSSQDVIGKTAHDIYPKDQADIYAAQDRAVLATGQALDRELEIREGNGSHFLHTIKFPILGADGEVTAIGGIAVDITERKRAEQALRESEQRLQRAVLDAPIPIMIHAEDGEVLMISRQWSTLTGYTYAEIPTISRWTELAYSVRGITEELREKIGKLYDIEEQTREGENHITTKSGGHRIWDFRSSPLGKLPDGRRIVISMAMDVTERRLAHEELERRVKERTAELRAAQAELIRQERLATLGQLTATVSHELRNPLGVIRTSAFVVRDGLKAKAPRAHRALDRIERGVIRCDRIIDEMLDFTRISELELETVPIDAWLAGVLEEQVVPRRVTVHNEFALPGVGVGLDRDRLRRAVINVFDNACQAMIADGSERSENAEHRLTVRTGAAAGRIELVFEDTGPGIPPEVLPRVFEPLFSTKGFGVGLGLSVVHQIMEQHGGGIEIENREGGGVRVCLWLPGDEPGP